MGLHMRWSIRRDLEQILPIERASFPHPWAEEDFLTALRQRNVIGMVAEENERVKGYFLYELGKRWLKVLNFAVAPNCRLRGVGEQMVAKLLGKLSQHRRTRIVWDVSDANEGGQFFLRAMGFTAVEYLRGHYTNTDGGPAEDGIRFEYRVGEQAVTPHNRVSQYLEGV